MKGTLLMALYSIRSERQFCERLQYDLLFKWFLGLNITDRAFDHSTFSKNRERLLKHDVAEHFLAAVTREAQRGGSSRTTTSPSTGRCCRPGPR